MKKDSMQQLWCTSHENGENASYIEGMYELFLQNPKNVTWQWREYFQNFNNSLCHGEDGHSRARSEMLLIAQGRRPLSSNITTRENQQNTRQAKIMRLVNAFRTRGHKKANIDPLGIMSRVNIEDLSLGFYGFSKDDLDSECSTKELYIGKSSAAVKEIYEILNASYCGTLGIEFMHIADVVERHWFQERLESMRGCPTFQANIKLHLLEMLVAAEGLEKYLGVKFPGIKRFGLEGGECLIPLLDELIQRSGSYGVQEIVMGMAHRGRLNVLVNILGKQPSDLFDEFEGKRSFQGGSGDVKYHQGFSTNLMTASGEVHLTLLYNPSHLEIISPVVAGSVRARQERRKENSVEKVYPIIIHGDAAFSGQGVVMETFQMSQTRGFKTGGTVHIIINNQVGFTTSKAEDARSTEYCTDVAKIIAAPVLHVNGDDPEAVLFAAQIALDYRMEFGKDVVIDLVCYRRRGHNEADEPSATQPVMYKNISERKTTRDLYAKRLIDSGIIMESGDKALKDAYRNSLDAGGCVVKTFVKDADTSLFVDWGPYLNHKWTEEHNTGVKVDVLESLGSQICEVPKGFQLQRQVGKVVADRKKMSRGEIPMNWGFAEVMAYASLLAEGHDVRITGQDVGRGTFSHRHAVLHDQQNGDVFIPLSNVTAGEHQFQIWDSLLSEEAVLAFEYGYTTTRPNVLVIWEAQFGDFANGAQVVIDQFIASGELKWGRLCGLTMLLPHGYEGQGPEHSSARLERYLQLSAQHNIQVCVPTTPSQIFHMLRRQIVRPLRKPLIAITPKSLLRHKLAVSHLEELSNNGFQTIIAEVDSHIPKNIERVILCSGKVYYELWEKRQKDSILGTAIVRIEQLYPFPQERLDEMLKQYSNLKNVVWCQEEPLNQGAWYCSQHHFRRAVAAHPNKDKVDFKCVAREASAAPSCGYVSTHNEEQQKLIHDAFTV